MEGSSWSATCILEDGVLIIASVDAATQKPISRDKYTFMMVEGKCMAMSESGAVRYVLDFKQRKFNQGQVGILIESGTIVTKTCVGKIIY
jgi:hypothetical protein